MKLSKVILILMAVFLINNISISNAQEKQKVDLEQKARGFVMQLSKGDYEGAWNKYNKTMAKVISAKTLQVSWEAMSNQLGKLKKISKFRIEKISTFDAAYVTCVFAGGKLDAQIIFNKRGEVVGFNFMPTGPSVGIF